MSELREAAQAVVDELADWISNGLIADLRAALAQPESEAHPPRDEWRPASEPPDSERLVIVWGRDAPESDPWFDAWWYIPGDGFVTGSGDLITHWRDVQPPTDSTIATEIAAARDEVKTWPKWMQDAARASAVAVPPTEGE